MVAGNTEVEGIRKPGTDDVLQLEGVLGKGAWGTVYKGKRATFCIKVTIVMASMHKRDCVTKLSVSKRVYKEYV
eukprot:1159779-Pelagomonas_calceolata.AAC.5